MRLFKSSFRPLCPLLLALAGATGCVPPPPAAPADLTRSLVIDVRSPEEFAENHIVNAKNLPYDQISETIGAIEPDKSRPIIVYCKSGIRSWSAQKSLRKLGYKAVRNGVCIAQLEKAGFGAETPADP
jgi:phage shock protein E